MTIVVFGSANIDLSVSVHTLPISGETVLGSDYRIGLGGKGLNQAVAASRLYQGTVRLIASIGDDHFGELINCQLERFGLSGEGIKIDPDNPTGLALIHIDPSGQNAITVSGGANLCWSVTDLRDEFFEKVTVGLCQLETPTSVTYHALRNIQSAGAITILDPAPIPQGGIDDLYPVVDILTPNQKEAEKLLGYELNDVSTAVAGATELCRKKALRAVIITMAEQGVVFSENGHDGVWVRARNVNAVDTVGAGDCFNGALGSALAEGESIFDAITFAITAASVSVTQGGAADSMPTRACVDAILSV